MLALLQLLCPFGFAILYTRTTSLTSTQSMPRAELGGRRSAKTLPARVMVGTLCLLLFVLFVMPMLALPLRSLTRLNADRAETGPIQSGLTTDYYRNLFVNSRSSIFYIPPIRAAGNSILYATITVFLTALLGFPAASALAKGGRFEKIIDPFLILPLGASAVTLGLGFIISFGSMLTLPLLVPLAHTLVALPFVIRILQPAIASIPDRLRQAAASLGANPLRVWLSVDWPILRRAGLSAAIFAFTISLGEFGATSLLSRPEYPTIPIAIFRFLSQPGGSNYGQAMAMATLLMALAFMGILTIERLRVPGMGEF